MSNGWRKAEDSIWGNWLPFIGFDTIAVDEDGYPVDSRHFVEGRDYAAMQVFMIAWLGRALIIQLPE